MCRTTQASWKERKEKKHLSEKAMMIHKDTINTSLKAVEEADCLLLICNCYLQLRQGITPTILIFLTIDFLRNFLEKEFWSLSANNESTMPGQVFKLKMANVFSVKKYKQRILIKIQDYMNGKSSDLNSHICVPCILVLIIARRDRHNSMPESLAGIMKQQFIRPDQTLLSSSSSSLFF